MDVPSVLAEYDGSRREYRNDLLHGTLAVLSAAEHYVNVTDKDIERALTLVDRVIRKVDKFVSGPTTLPVPPVVLSDQDDAA